MDLTRVINKKFILTFAGIVLVLSLILWFVGPKKQNINILESSPTMGAENVPIYVTPTYSFSEAVTPNSVRFEIIPQVPFSVSQVKENDLVVSPRRLLQPATIYTINVYLDNQIIYPHSFTTELSQTDPQLIEDMKAETRKGLSTWPKTTTQSF
jgi:hypothetical protein